MNTETAVIAGAGPGLGRALAKRFAREGCPVALLARDAKRLDQLAKELGAALPIPTDLTDAKSVAGAFERIDAELGSPHCVIFNAGAFRPGRILDLSPSDFEQCWRVGCWAGFLVGQEAARRMVDRGAGSILFTGATASLRGSAGFANLASPKFALRALAQSMARELGPRGVHVAHVVIDGQIRSPRYEALVQERGPDSLLEPGAIADAYWHLHRQPRSAWTHELDLRPWVEKF
jgi:NAD(P)-dependent dehydrogenase (short-subunit alcohol dehydrogenase family)